MMLCKHIPMKTIYIWEPRWRDRRVLLATYKVGEHNKIVFSGNPVTKNNSMGTEPFYISGKKARKFKKEDNGTISVYSIPLDVFEPLEIKERCEHSD